MFKNVVSYQQTMNMAYLPVRMTDLYRSTNLYKVSKELFRETQDHSPYTMVSSGLHCFGLND